MLKFMIFVSIVTMILYVVCMIRVTRIVYLRSVALDVLQHLCYKRLTAVMRAKFNAQLMHMPDTYTYDTDNMSKIFSSYGNFYGMYAQITKWRYIDFYPDLKEKLEEIANNPEEKC